MAGIVCVRRGEYCEETDTFGSVSPRMNVGSAFNGTLRFSQGHKATVRVDEAHSPLERRNERRELEIRRG